jgi:hypothetical protein
MVIFYFLLCDESNAAGDIFREIARFNGIVEDEFKAA